MQRYTSSTYNDAAGYTRSVRTNISPGGKETVMQSTGIGGTYIQRQVESPALAPAPIPEYTRTYTSGAPISPGRVVETHLNTPGGMTHAHITNSPGTVVETRIDAPPGIHTSTVTMSPVRSTGMLRMTSSPMRKPVTTTRTHFEPGFTVTEELPTNPHVSPTPLPGETIAVTHATGREGIHTRTMDGIGGFTETIANRKSPVRTYTTTIYEEGEPPRTYTTTFQDPVPIIAPGPLPATLAGSHTFVSSTEPAPLPAPAMHSRVEYNGLGRSETRVEAGPLGHRERTVHSGIHGHHESSIQRGPYGHQQRHVSSTPYGHHETNLSSTPYGHHETNVNSTPYGHHQSSVHSTPFGHEERRVSSSPLGHEETTVQHDAYGSRQKTTVTQSPARLEQAITLSQKIAEAPVDTYY